MSAERLSRLQKWILAEAAKAPGEFFDRREIFLRFFDLRQPYDDHKYKQARAASVSIARSLCRLEQRGFVKIRSGFQLPEEERRARGFLMGDFSRVIDLTKEGKGMAESLNVNPSAMDTRVNNKTRKRQ